MSDNLTVGGISYDNSKFVYKYDEKNKKHVFTSRYGLSITCPSQSTKNKAELYAVSDDEGEFAALTNIANAKVENRSNGKYHKINLIGCNGCFVDGSKNNKTDWVEIYNSDKFKSQNNLIKSDGKDKVEVNNNNDESGFTLMEKGVYSENKLKEQINENPILEMWHRFISNPAKVSDK